MSIQQSLDDKTFGYLDVEVKEVRGEQVDLGEVPGSLELEHNLERLRPLALPAHPAVSCSFNKVNYVGKR